MSLGFLAKDSIQDLEALGREAEAQEEAAALSKGRASFEGSVAESGDKSPASLFSPGGEEKNEHRYQTGQSEASVTISQNSGSTAEVEATPGVASTESTLVTAANPQQAQEDDEGESQQPDRNTHQYAGFRSDYPPYRSHFEPKDSLVHNRMTRKDAGNNFNNLDQHQDLRSYNYYFHDTYAPPVLMERQNAHLNPFQGFLFCIFPWLASSSNHGMNRGKFAMGSFEPVSYETNLTGGAAAGTDATASADGTGSIRKKESTGDDSAASGSDDDVSTSSDVLGEKLSEKERQAVLARLRLVQPADVPGASAAHATTEPHGPGTEHSSKKGLLNGIPTYDTSPLLHDSKVDDGGGTALAPPKPLKGILKRRVLPNALTNASNASLPLSGSRLSISNGNDKDTNGGTPARRRSLFPNYEPSSNSKPRTNNRVGFAPMARVVTVKSKNDMDLEEKADIWWQKNDYEDFKKTGRLITKAILEGGSEIWLASNESWKVGPTTSRGATLKHAYSMSDRESQPTIKNSPSPTAVADLTGDKWWHKFGHSRRGLEHVVSIEEGRQRQMNVRTAIRAVLEEQSRQKMYNRQDAEKLRIVSLNHTAWARDLALAAGASDADAVKSSFAEDRKSREFFLLKFAKSDPNASSSHLVPEFMQPAVHAARLQTARRLDANTAAQVRFRRQSQLQQQGPPSNLSSSSEFSASERERRAALPMESAEPIRDPESKKSGAGESLAHRAAGFGEKADMAAVLSGMGALSSSPSSSSKDIITATA